MEQNNDYVANCIAQETAALTIEGHTLLKCVTDKEKVYIPDGVKQIASNAFAECKNLRFIGSRECLRDHVALCFEWGLRRCAHDAKYWLEEYPGDKYKNAQMSLLLCEVSNEDYTYALQQSILQTHCKDKAGNSIQWKSLSVDIKDLLNHTIDESIANQLPIIHPGSFIYTFPKKEKEVTSLSEEVARLGFGILRITGINKKELLCKPQFSYYNISELHSISGYGIVSPQWLIVMDMTSEIKLDFSSTCVPCLISPYISLPYDSLTVDEYMDMKRSQGNVIELP